MPKPRKRKQANPFEAMLGVHGATTARVSDMFTNGAARMGFGTPSLGQGAEYSLVRISYDYWQLITLFRNHWISRRIVEVPAQDCVKAWPKLTSDIEPKDITRIDRALRKTNTKNNILTGLTWGRLFGGAGALIVVDGQENELDQPLDLESVKIGAYKGVIPFDRWAGITPLGDVCTDVNRPLDFNKPEMYEVRVAGGSSFQVHSSRLLRFLGPTVPTPELEAQSYWGISVLEPTYESITMLDNMFWNILSLSFRANLLGMKFPELSQLLSGLGSSQVASQKFEQRMSTINQLMSNNSLIPLPADGGIESTQYSFGGLGEVLQLFQLNLAGAAQMPVTRLFGRTYNGLGQAGDGDERIYEEKIATDQATYMVPQLEKLYPVICMSELGEVPDDLDLVCPSIRVLGEQEKSDLAKSVADTTTVYLNGGIMSPRKVAQEVKRSSDITGIGATLDDEYIARLSDDVQSEGEMGEGLFGGEGAGLNEASSPAKAIKSENEKDKEKQDEPDGDGPDGGPKKGPVDPKRDLAENAGKARGTAPAMDELPSGLSVGESLLVGGRMLTVAGIGSAVEDLDGQEAVPVSFTDGSVVAYRPSKVQARDESRFGTIRRTVECPYCRTGYTFQSEAKLVAFKADPTKPLHPACIKAAKGLATDEDGASSVTRRAQEVIDYHALPVRIESRRGDARTGTTPDGASWRTVMPADYGFIEGVDGADGDSVDCYVGPSPESSNVYVVDQHGLDGRGFDEHKVMLGYHTQESALEDYMLGHHLSGKTFAAVTAFTMPLFRKWLKTHDMAEPCAESLARALDEAKFEESKHPRAANGQFGSGGGAAAMPKGMEHVVKGAHKTVASFAVSLLGEHKYSDADIAKAAQVIFGGKTSAASVAWYKAQAKKKTPEGAKAAAAKQQAVKANDAKISAAAKSPPPFAQVDAKLTQAEKAGYKTMYVSAKDNNGKATYFKVSGVPDGLDNQATMAEVMEKKGLTVVNSGPYDPKKPAPPSGYADYALPDGEAAALKEAAYAKAAAAEKAAAESKALAAQLNKPATETVEELSANMQKAVKHYTDGSYSELNANLRKGQPLSAEQAALAADLDAAIKKGKLTSDMTLYRKMSHPQAFLGPNPKVGTVLIDNGFVSTSKNSAVWSGKVHLTILCKKGAAALDVQSLSLHSGEKEVMLPRGSLFRVKGIKGMAVEVEYLG